MIDSTLIHVNNANSTDDVTINQSMTTPVHESALDIAIDTHVNGNINDEASDIAGSSSQDPEPVPDEPRVDLIPAGDVALKTDVEMVDSNSLSIVTPPSPAPSGVSQPINELSLNDISRSSPSYSAPISPSTAHASAPNGHLALFAPHRERRVDDSHATTDEHRPAKRARTADVTSVSVTTLCFHTPILYLILALTLSISSICHILSPETILHVGTFMNVCLRGSSLHHLSTVAAIHTKSTRVTPYPAST